MTVDTLLLPSREPSFHPEASPRGSSLPFTTILVSLSIVLSGFGYLLGRDGHPGLCSLLFYLGVAATFVGAAPPLLSAATARSQRMVAALLLSMGLWVQFELLQPFMPIHYDELLHGSTLWSIVGQRHLGGLNPLLPVSPYYPGLELFTAALHWLTGTPLWLDELATTFASKCIFVVCLFLVSERLWKSARAAGITALVYAASPQFLFFNSQYAYQTLAIALALLFVHLVLSGLDAEGRARRDRFIAAGLTLLALQVTHHLTSWIVSAGILCWWGLLFRRGERRATVVGRFGLLAAAMSLGWSAVVGFSRIGGYIVPIFSAAATQFSSMLDGKGGSRKLFTSTTGTVSPAWERGLLLLSAVAWTVVICSSIWVLYRRRQPGSLRGSRREHLWLMCGAFLYPVSLLGSLTSSSADVAARSSTFSFMAVGLLAPVVVLHPPERLWALFHRPPRFVAQGAIVLFATALGVAGVVQGYGPDIQHIPGPYVTESTTGTQRSLDVTSVTAAEWAADNLPVGARITADLDNSLLMSELGHLRPVTSVSGLASVYPLYISPTNNPEVLDFLRQNKVSYVLVDTRLANENPDTMFDYAPGETANARLTLPELDKFAVLPHATQVFSDGPISIYDVTAISAARVHPLKPADSTDERWPVTVVAALLGLLLLWIRPRFSAAFVGIALPVTMGLAAAFAISGLSATAIPLAALVAIGAAVLIRARRTPAGASRSRRRLTWPVLLAVTIALAGVAVGLLSAAHPGDTAPASPVGIHVQRGSGP
jgi:hypothetical protein